MMKFKKSIAKLIFSATEKGILKLPSNRGPWFCCTQDCEPNDWTVRVIPIQDIQPDNTVLSEIDFLMESANYLLVSGTKFAIRGFDSFRCQVEVIKEF
jgi:hypothetical protein